MSEFDEGLAIGLLLGSDDGGGGGNSPIFDDIIANKIEIGTIYSYDIYKITLNLWWTNDMTVAQCAGFHVMEDANGYPIAVAAIPDEPSNTCYLMFITYENNTPICATICRKGDATAPYVMREDKTYRTAFKEGAGNKGVCYKQAESLKKDGIWTFSDITNINALTQGSSSATIKTHWTNRFEFKVTGTLNYRYRSRTYNISTGVLSDWTYMDFSQSFEWDYTIAGGCTSQPLVIVSWDCTYYKVPLSTLCRVWTQINYNINRYMIQQPASRLVIPTYVDG